MNQSNQFLSWPENWQASHNASLYVLQTLDPSKAEFYRIFIDSGLDMVADGEVTAIYATDEAGGFGTPDILVAVVVPAVVSALATILTQAGMTTMADFRRKRTSGKEIVSKVNIYGEIEPIIKTINPSLNPREVNRLVFGIQDALQKFLTTDDLINQQGFSPTELRQLRVMIHQHFNEGELRTLCFDLNIDYEDCLIGETKQDKVRELLLYCTRRGRVTDLVNACRQARPQVDW